ncbi:MAG: xanthine dehydrogenase FAD-binding subunit XdhB [Bacillota bacterium]|nr:xanthine dehydrogenase FAD-binding subunit XdhB [Bacillota bacterium]
MYRIDEYIEAESIIEVLKLLSEKPERKIIAGGTDLLIDMRNNPLESVRLISIRNINPLYTINRLDNGSISIGPMVTFSRLANHPLIRENLPLLVEAAMSIGGPQLREMATIGGNLCNGVPSADSAPALLVYEAKLLLQSQDAERTVPVKDFYHGPGQTDLRPGELLTAIHIDEDAYTGFSGTYIKFAPRKAMDLAIIGVAVACRLDKQQNFEKVRIGLGVAGPTPLRCPRAESLACGNQVSAEMIKQIGSMTLEETSPRSSWRASAEYRRHLIRELTIRALKTAVSRAGGNNNA